MLFVLAVLGLCFCTWAFSSCNVRASHCSGFWFSRARALEHAGCSSCGTWAYLLHNMWNYPRPRIKPGSPILAGRLNHWTTRGVLDFCFFFFLAASQHVGSYLLDQGFNLGPLQWKHRVLNTGLPGAPPDSSFYSTKGTLLLCLRAPSGSLCPHDGHG